jgi:osmotically inducible protein OsmC
MALSGDLTKAGFPPNDIRASAEVHLDQVEGRWTITAIDLTVGADVPKIDEAAFLKIAQGTVMGCPVSRALSGVKINLDATLRS